MPSIGLTIPFALINSFGSVACKLLPYPPRDRRGRGIWKYEDKSVRILQDQEACKINRSSDWKHFPILHLNLSPLFGFKPVNVEQWAP